MATVPKQRMNLDDWLAIERATIEGKTQYVDGEVFAMAGGTETHNLICANVLGSLWGRFRSRPCYVYTSDMKVRVDAAGLGAYPDVMAVCGERTFFDDRKDVLANPTLIVEVLSDSTEGFDRGDKFACYRAIESLSAYLLLCQHHKSAELYERLDDGGWRLRAYDAPGDEIPLVALGTCLPLAEVYDKTELAPRKAGTRVSG